MLRCILVLFAVGFISADDIFDQFTKAGGVSSRDGLTSFSEFAEQKNPFSSKPEVHENVKTFIVTKRVPMPYTVHVEKKVPYPVKIPVRRPYAVYVPKPYLVEVTKQIPYPVKVPMPQPYTVEKHIPVPFKIPFDKPYPVHISKPFPVFVEKKVPYPVEKHIPIQVKIPYDRPYPVHIPVEKPVLYPVEKPIAMPYKISLKSPTFQHAIQQQTYTVEKPVKQTDIDDIPQQPQQKPQQTASSLKTVNNFTPSTYDADTSSQITHGKHKVISFLPGSHDSFSSNEPIEFGTIHVPGTNSFGIDNSSNDWIPKQQFTSSQKQPVAYSPQVSNHYRYVLPDVKTATSFANVANGHNAQTPKETYTLKYDPKKQEYKFHFEPTKQEYQVKYEVSKPEYTTYSTPLYEVKAPQLKPQQIQSHETSHGFQPVEGKKDKSKNNYQFYNIHPQKDPKGTATSGVSFQKFESSETGETTQQASKNYSTERVRYQYVTQKAPNVQYEQIPQFTQQSHVIQQTLPPSYYEEQHPQASQEHASYDQELVYAPTKYVQNEEQPQDYSGVSYQVPQFTYYRTVPMQDGRDDVPYQTTQSVYQPEDFFSGYSSIQTPQDYTNQEHTSYKYDDLPQTNSHTGPSSESHLATKSTTTTTTQAALTEPSTETTVEESTQRSQPKNSRSTEVYTGAGIRKSRRRPQRRRHQEKPNTD